jgi:hypothetical protein
LLVIINKTFWKNICNIFLHFLGSVPLTLYIIISSEWDEKWTIRPDNLQTDNRNGFLKKSSLLHDEIMKSFAFLLLLVEWEKIACVSCWKPTTFCYFTVKRER